MTIKSLVFILFLCVCLVWVGAAYLHPGPEFTHYGLRWTAWLLIATLAFLIGTRLWGWWRRWRARAAVRPVGPPTPPAIVHEDVAAMAALVAEGNSTLAKSPNYPASPGKAPLCGLPLYLLIGPEGSGKTTTFLNSGIEPQSLAGESTGTAAASTRVCSLWLAKNAVFAEISGRIFGGEIGLWSEILSVLRGKAPVPFWRRLWREPDEGLQLRGVIGFCDVRELTGSAADPQRLERGCRAYQERLRSVGEVFGVTFPVYQVFTKCDKIPFFSDFFARLPESEVNQVVGCTLPMRQPGLTRAGDVSAEAEAKRLTAAFRPLYHSLAERRLICLAHEPNPARKPGVYEFPRELKRIRAALVQFLTDVFRPHPLRPVPYLRGFYLTATQEVEVAIAKPAASEGAWTSPSLSLETTGLFRADATQIFTTDEPGRTIQPRGNKGTRSRWIFASDLFHEIVLADRPPLQRVAPKDAPFERYRRGVFAAIWAACALLCFAFVTSWENNRSLLGEVRDTGQADFRKHGNVATVFDLQALDNLRSKVEELERGEPWLSYHWVLYQGGAILDSAKKAYFGRFQDLLLTDLNRGVVGQLRNLSAKPSPDDPYEPAYDFLKTHLAISSGSCKADPALVSRVLKGQLPADATPRWQELANRQIDFYTSALSRGNPCHLPEDIEARDQARAYLRGINNTERIYKGILEKAEKTLAKPPQLADLAPNYKQVLSGDGTVLAAFTQAGWNFVQTASKNAGNTGAPDDACVIGSSQGGVSFLKQDEAEKKIQELFVNDYIHQWQKFVAGFSVVSYNSPDDAIRRLDILSGHTSPLLAVLKMAADQTNFSVPVETGVLAGAKKTVTNTLNNIIGSAEKKVQQATGATTPTDQRTLSLADITRFFQPVQFVVPPGSDKWINEKNTAYMDALSGLRTAIVTISRPSADTPPDPQAGQTAKDKAEDSVRQLAKGFNSEGVGTLDRDVTHLLEEPIAYADRFLAPPRPDLKTNAAAQTFCNSFQPLLKKYPFNPAAPESPASEATLKDLQDYFAPDEGKIWKFQKSALVDLTILDGGVWKPNPASQKLKPSQELLDFLNRAQQLRKAFFSDGNSPHLTYSLRPVLASGSKQVIQLTIDGQSHDFTADLQLRHAFTWPAAAGVEAKADGRSGTAGFTAGFDSHYGLWAAFRLFGDAVHRELGAVAIEWKETKGGTGRPQPLEPPVQLEFAGGFPGGVDVFNPDFFKGFGCPLKPTQ